MKKIHCINCKNFTRILHQQNVLHFSATKENYSVQDEFKHANSEYKIRIYLVRQNFML